MRSVTFAAAAALGLIVFACGTDTESSPNQNNIPTTSVCPGTKVHPLAISTEDLAPKNLADMTIALTFDSGPSEATDDLETYLKGQSIQATFFVTGQNITDQFKASLTQASTDGHLIANRGNDDDDMTNKPGAEIVQSVTTTDTLISALVPDNKFYFRPPYGGWTPADGQALAASPMSKYTGPVVWDIGDDLDPSTGSDSDCFAPDTGTAKTPQQCGDLFLTQIRAKKKGIVLMHDGPPDSTGPQTQAMVQYMIPILKTEGYKFVRVDALDLVPESSLETGDDDGATTLPDGGVIPDPTDDPCKTH